jgi:hypothetical protein
MDKKKKSQKWCCEVCRREGTVEHDEHADVHTVTNMIEEDHKRISPDCDCPVRKLRCCTISELS